MWSDITISVTDCEENIVLVAIHVCDVEAYSFSKVIEKRIEDVFDRAEDIIKSCNTQGGHVNQLLLDYRRCLIYVDGEVIPRVEDFIQLVYRKTACKRTARHVLALCTQAVMADFLAFAIDDLQSKTNIIVDNCKHARPNPAQHTLVYRVSLPSTAEDDGVHIQIDKPFNIYEQSAGDTIKDIGKVNIQVKLHLGRKRYGGMYKITYNYK